MPVLNWHELGAGGDYNGNTMKKNLDSARNKYQNSPTYAALKIEKLIIGEAFRTEDAGLNLANFSAFEAGLADGAINSCFDADCEKRTLSGLLVDNFEKSRRSSWYVWKNYATGVLSRVSSTPTDYNLPVLGSRMDTETKKPMVLIGNNYSVSSTMTINLSGLNSLGQFPGDKVSLKTYKLANSGINSSNGFALESTTEHSILNGSVSLSKTLDAQSVVAIYLEMDGVTAVRGNTGIPEFSPASVRIHNRYISVSIQEDGPHSIRVTDMLGKEVLKQVGSNRITYQLNRLMLSRGVLLLEVRTSKGVCRKKLVQLE